MFRLLTAASASLLLLAACQQQPAASPERSETAAVAPEAIEAPAPGETAPAFTLVDAEGHQRSLADFRGKTVVLEWTNEGCPFVKKHYSGAMQALQREATADGVVWLTIISSSPGTQGFVEGEEAQAWKAKHQAAFTHLLLDPTGEVASATTPRPRPTCGSSIPRGG